MEERWQKQGERGGQDHEVLRGEVRRIRFQKPEEGFVIFELGTSRGRSPTVVVGNSQNLHEGVEVAVTGSFTSHKKFGEQFRAKDIAVVPPSSQDGIMRYLSCGIIPGIGEKLAQRIVRHFGTSTLDVLEQTPERIKEVSGVGKQKARAITEYLQENSSLHEIRRFLTEHQISPGLAQRIYQRYGNRSIEKLKKNPYLLAKDLSGVGFLTADSVAVRLGVDLDSPERHRAGILYVLERSRNDGHCYLPKAQLLSEVEQLLQRIPSEWEHEEQLEYLQAEASLELEGDRVYLTSLAAAERWIADFTVKRLEQRKKPLLDEKTEAAVRRRVEKAMEISFSGEQESAISSALRYKLLVLTGGPGCGKTTVVRAIVESLREAHCRIVLTAPTGRAAQRLSQVTGAPAKTIHRLLRFDPFTKKFFFGPENSLEEDGNPVDVVIVDESSMIDLPLAKALFSALPHKATLILVGDKDQLPSVGPGRVFGELLSVSQVPTVRLSQLYRREGSSLINEIAYQVNAGIDPLVPEPDGETKTDAYFIPRNDPTEAAQMIERLYTDQIPKKFGIDPEDITVLTPSNRGELGTHRLNSRLQQALRSREQGTFYLSHSDEKFFEGDRVCQRKNNYQIDEQGVFNGDVGVIDTIDNEEGIITVTLWDGRTIEYTAKEIPQLMLAYALTVHRSQGSEIPCVILALHESHYNLLERQLIYTGITRAKKLLIIVGSRKALSLASKRSQSKRRFCSLTERIELLLS